MICFQIFSYRMLLQSGCVLLRQVATSSVRNFPNCWNCVVRIPEGNHFHFFKRSFTSRSFQTNVFSSVSVKFNRHGQKFAILTNCARFRSTNVKSQDGNWKDRLWYSLAVAIFMTGATILSVPLYRVFCQVIAGVYFGEDVHFYLFIYLSVTFDILRSRASLNKYMYYEHGVYDTLLFC